MKRVFSIFIAALLIAAAVLPAAGCARIKKAIRDAVLTPAPTVAPATEPPTEAPTELPVTEEPVTFLRFVNGMESGIRTVELAPADADDWGACAIEEDFTEARFDFQNLPFAAGEEFDVLLVDENGLHACFTGVTASQGDTLTFQSETEEHLDGEVTYIWLTRSGPSGEEEYYSAVYSDEQAEKGAVDLVSHRHLLTFDDEGTVLMNAVFDNVSPFANEAGRYPRLAEALNEDIFDGMADEFEASFAAMEGSLKTEAADDPDFAPFTVTKKAFVRRADAAVFSLLYLTTYPGSGDGYEFSSFNYVPRNGRRLTVADVVKDVTALPYLIAEQLEYRESGFEPDYGDVRAFFSENSDKYAWTLDPTGLMFYFPTASDPECVLIPYTDNEHLFNERFLDVPEDWFMYLPEYLTAHIDLNGDGELTELLTGKMGEEGENCSVMVQLNGVSVSESVPNGNFTPVLVRNAGRTYLYLENDSGFLSVFDLNGRRARLVETLPWSFMRYNEDSDEDSAVAAQLITDPEGFALWHSDVFPVGGLARHTVAADGLPEDDGYFTCSAGEIIYMKLKQPITCFYADGDYGTPVTVDPEDLWNGLVALIATDNSTFIIIDVDDDLMRVEIDASGGTPTIDGKPFSEVFDVFTVMQ